MERVNEKHGRKSAIVQAKEKRAFGRRFFSL